MTVKTDFHAVDHHGTRDFVFQCHKRPFAMTVNPLFPKPSENLIDSELVEFLNIPVKKIEARRFSFAGIDTRIVGHISQTVQCVVKGKICGTTHLKAAVVKTLFRGKTLFRIQQECGATSLQELSPNLVKKHMKYVEVPEAEKWKAGLIKELLLTSSRVVTVGNFEHSEIKMMIDHLCTG